MRNPFSIRDIKKHPLYEQALEKLRQNASVIPLAPETEDKEIRFIIADMMNLKYQRTDQWPVVDDPDAWKNTIHEDHVVCMICGEKLKLLTKAHLRKHGGDKAEYRRHFHIPFTVPLASDDLIEERRKAMTLNKIWKYKKEHPPVKKKVEEKIEKIESDNFDDLLGLS